ncbi:MAG: hypothetical protein DYH13_10350 [Alphaproteobacteria bacterium PRO2]|nr:hypothetical protein [Alphaproteobacteria bacterium PRO2]
MDQAENQKPENSPNAFVPFLLAPVIPAVLFIIVNFGRMRLSLFPRLPHEIVNHFENLAMLSIVVIFIAWAIILVFAMPLYFILKASGRLRPLYIISAAGFITIIPDLFMEIYRLGDIEDSSFYSYGNCEAIIEGVRTVCGYRLFFQMLIEHAAYGCLAGYIFCGLYFKKWALWKKAAPDLITPEPSRGKN